MIELINASKYYPTPYGRHYIFRNVSLKLPRNKNIAIIGPNGAGKSTLLRLLAGGDIPNEGKIVRTGRISWPLGLTPGLQNALSGVENARFAGRIYGMNSGEIKDAIERIRQIADIGKFFDLPVENYSSGMRQRVSFAVSMAMEFDYYLFDEIGAGGDSSFKAKTKAMIGDRLSKANFILTTHDFEDVTELCQAVIVLGGGQLRYFEDVTEALKVYGQEFIKPKKAKKVPRPPKPAGEAALDENGPGGNEPAAPPNGGGKARLLERAAELEAARASLGEDVAKVNELKSTMAALTTIEPGSRRKQYRAALREELMQTLERMRASKAHFRKLERQFERGLQRQTAASAQQSDMPAESL